MEVILLFLILSFLWNATSKDIAKIISCLCVIICSITLTVILIYYISEYIPTSLDVYEGKTTLEITYRDSIP